jgi:hypothetical protein
MKAYKFTWQPSYNEAAPIHALTSFPDEVDPHPYALRWALCCMLDEYISDYNPPSVKEIGKWLAEASINGRALWEKQFRDGDGEITNFTLACHATLLNPHQGPLRYSEIAFDNRVVGSKDDLPRDYNSVTVVEMGEIKLSPHERRLAATLLADYTHEQLANLLASLDLVVLKRGEWSSDDDRESGGSPG